MKAATLTEERYYTIVIDGLKPKWTPRAKDIVDANDMVYVRLDPQNKGLCAIVCTDNDDMDKRWPLCGSKGLATMLQVRNLLQAKSFAQDVVDKECSLFAGAPTKKPCNAHTRAQQLDNRKSPATMVIELNVAGVAHEVSVLRPSHPTDNLFVACDAESIAIVIAFMRAQGWDDAPARNRPSNMPQGIHMRKDGKVNVKYTQPDGSIRFKTVLTLEDAVAFQADPQLAIEGEGMEDVDEADASNVVDAAGADNGA
jgi:hypothetical protein